MCFLLNLKTKVKWNIKEDEYSFTSVTSIGNVFVELSCTKSKVTLFEFDYNISKTPIPIGYAKTFIDLTNYTSINNLNYTPLLNVYYNLLLYTSHCH